jgi:hypothetical protein
MMLGIGLGGIALPLLAQRLIVMFGWSTAYATFGCAVLLLCLPIMAAMLRNDPREKGLLPDGVVPSQRGEIGERWLDGLSWHDIWHQPTFWLLICALFLAGASLHACVLHMAALVTDRGISAQGAAAVSSVVGGALLIGRIGTGYLLDRLFAPRLAMLVFGSGSGATRKWIGAGVCSSAGVERVVVEDGAGGAARFDRDSDPDGNWLWYKKLLGCARIHALLFAASGTAP